MKTYIDKNHHLPDMHSAHRVEKDGLEIVEMNKLLLKKVEGLTLYLIRKDSELKQLKGRLDRIERKAAKKAGYFNYYNQ